MYDGASYPPHMGDVVGVVIVWVVRVGGPESVPIPNVTVKDLNRLDIPKKPLEIRAEDFNLEGEYGTVTYKGLKWMGEIAEAFLEVWKRNPATGLAVKDGTRTVWLQELRMMLYTN
jgi:hypothetical protein